MIIDQNHLFSYRITVKPITERSKKKFIYYVVCISNRENKDFFKIRGKTVYNLNNFGPIWIKPYLNLKGYVLYINKHFQLHIRMQNQAKDILEA